jgi:hypothetical protein
MYREESETVTRANEIIVLSIDFITQQRSLNLFDHARVKKLGLFCQEAFVSSAAEHGGTIIESINNRGTASYPDPNEALKSAIRIGILLTKRNGNVPEEQRIGFAAFINKGDGTVDKNEIYGQVAIELREMMKVTGRKNRIKLSEKIHETVKGMEGTWYQHAGTASDGFSCRFGIYEVFWKDSINLEAHESISMHQFQNRYRLIEGVQEPCFYCGSRKHLLSDCPSKHMPEITQAFDKVGHMSIAQINTLFTESIAAGLDTVRDEWENTGDIPDNYFNAYHAFYDIKRVYQLRFFRVIMGYTGNSWSKATRMNAAENDGGTLLVAFDHLRTGNLTQAETLLRRLYDENPRQPNVNMAMGYLNIEKGHRSSALSNFENAYKNAGTRPGKILALLILCRIHDLYFNDMETAGEQINLIRKLENDCPEAIYQDIIIGMRNKKGSSDTSRLAHLIKNHREYYLIALIDPELIGCQVEINRELDSLFAHAKENAAHACEEAENNLTRLDSWLGENNETGSGLRETFSPIKELYSGDSYLGYLDAFFKAPSISAGCKMVENKGRDEIGRLMTDLHNQIRELSDYCERERSLALVHTLRDLTEGLDIFENDLHLSVSYKEATTKIGEFSEQVKIIHAAVEKLKKRKAIASFVIGLSIKALLFSIVTLSLCFFVLLIIVL